MTLVTSTDFSALAVRLSGGLRVMQAWSATRLLVFWVGLAIGLSALWGGFHLWPLWQSGERLQSQLLQTQSTRLHAQTALHAQAAKQPSDVKWPPAWTQAFPHQLQSQTALQQMERLATRYGIRMHRVRAQSPQARSGYRAQEFVLDAEGDYHAWGQWLADLQQVQPVMWVQAWQARATGAHGLGVQVRMQVAHAARPLPAESEAE